MGMILAVSLALDQAFISLTASLQEEMQHRPSRVRPHVIETPSCADTAPKYLA
jgi:hypothetical protein